MNSGTLYSLSGIARFGRQPGSPLAWVLGFRRGKTPALSTLSRTLRRFDVDTKTNERKAALELLGILSIAGKLVTGDALFCRRDPAASP